MKPSSSLRKNIAFDFMTNIELEAIKKVFATENDVQVFFEDIIKAALSYKLKVPENQTRVLISEKDITTSIFSLTAKDKVKIYDQIINGQRIIELFICSIYLKQLIRTLDNEYILIAFPSDETDYDIAFFAVDKKNIPSSNRFHIPRDSVGYYIQVKENFNYEEFKKFDENKEPSEFNIEGIKKAASKYENVLVLFFSRNYSLFKSEVSSDFLMKNKNVGIILTPSLDLEKIPITGGKDKGREIPLQKGLFNFLLETDDKTIHITFTIPKFLVKASEGDDSESL